MKFAFALTVAAIAAMQKSALSVPAAHGPYENHAVAGPYGHVEAQAHPEMHHMADGRDHSHYNGALNHHEDSAHLTVVNPEHSGHGFSREQFVHGYDGARAHYEAPHHAPIEAAHLQHPIKSDGHGHVAHAVPRIFYGGHDEPQGELKADGKIYGPVVRRIQEALPQIIRHDPHAAAHGPVVESHSAYPAPEPHDHHLAHHVSDKHLPIDEPKVTYESHHIAPHPEPHPAVQHVEVHAAPKYETHHSPIHHAGPVLAHGGHGEHVEAHPEPHYAAHAVHGGEKIVYDEPNVGYAHHPEPEPIAHHAVHPQAHPQFHEAVHHGPVHHEAVHHGPVHHGSVHHEAVHHGPIHHGAIHHSAPVAQIHAEPEHVAHPEPHPEPVGHGEHYAQPEPAPIVPDHPDSYQGPHEYGRPREVLSHAVAVHDPSAYTALQFVNHAYGERPGHDFHQKSHAHFAQLFDSFYAHRMPGDGFGPGGHFSPMPKPELKMVPVPTPVDKPYPVPIDKPYPVKYIAKIIQPHVHKQTIVKSHISYKEHTLDAPHHHHSGREAVAAPVAASAHNNFGLDYSIEK